MLANSFYSTHSVFNNSGVSQQHKPRTMLPSIHHLPLPNFSEMTLPPINPKQQFSEYRYKCKMCSKCFNRKNSLVRHERIHSGVKPYSCKVCNKQFTRKDILEGHKLSIKCQRRTQYYSETPNCRSSTTGQLSSFQSSTPPPLESSRRTSIDSLLSSEEVQKAEINLSSAFTQSLINSEKYNYPYYY